MLKYIILVKNKNIMDKNTIIGFVLIAAILIGYSVYSQPSDEEIAQQIESNP